MVTAEMAKSATTAGPYEIPENLLATSVLDKLAAEISSYPTEKCTTRIESFQIVGGGTVLNVGETFQFKVRVDNNGKLNMKTVKVKVMGTAYADVAPSSGGSFGTSVTSDPFELRAGDTYISDTFRGKAKAATGGTAKDIVKAQIDAWDANLDHILLRLSRAGAAEGKLNKVIDED